MKAASLFTTPAVVAHAHAQLVAWQRRPHRPINRPTDQPCSRGGTDGRGGGTHGDILSRPSGRPSVCPFFHPWSEVASPLLLSAAVKTGASERANEQHLSSSWFNGGVVRARNDLSRGLIAPHFSPATPTPTRKDRGTTRETDHHGLPACQPD